MAEYIEREALLKVLRGSAVGKYPASFYVGLFAAAEEVEKIPAADVVPVVRCKDCKHYRHGKHFTDINFCQRLPYYAEKGGLNTADDDFCSYGERRVSG